MLEWLAVALPIIADNVLGYTLDQSGLGEKLREKIKPDATKAALQHALTITFGHFKQKYPQLVDEKFLSTSFQDRRSGPILGQLLLRNGQPNADDLANLWATLRYPNDETLRLNSLNTFKPIAKVFLDDLDNALKAESVLQETYNNIALEHTATGVAAMDTNIAAILHKLTNEPDLAQIRRDYLHWLVERNMYLDLRGIPQTQRQVQVKLEEVYIVLKAQRDEAMSTSERSSLERELQELEQHVLLSSAEDIDDQRDLIAHRFKKRGSNIPTLERTKGEIRDLSTVVAQHDRLLILGDPGCGKTTLLRYLALKHAQATQNGESEASSELGKARFPILLRIADYAEHGKGKSISDFLAVYCSLYECPHASTGLAEMFATELKSGNCLILLDGLDEIISIDDRMHVVRQIEDFVRHHHSTGNRFVITSRVAGYRNARLNGDYAHYQVQEMDDTQIRHFLDMWCPAVEYAQTPDLSEEARMVTAKREINGIMDAVEHTPGVRRLAANPLLLCTLALIHRTGAMLPQKRIELYKLAADVLTRTWRVAQGVRSTELLDEGEITKLLRELAYWMHVNKPTGIATEREIIKVWANVKGTDEDDLLEEQKVKAFLHQVEVHTGLFVERAPKRYGFMHLTFEEYYAARYLVARSRTRAQLIRKHLHEPRWEEPILLALGFVGMDAPEDAAELIDAAILAQGELAEELGFMPSKYEDLLARDYLFALRCLGDQMPVSDKTMSQLVERLSSELLFQSGSARFERYRKALGEKLYYLRGSKAANWLLSIFIRGLSNSSVFVRESAIESLRLLRQASTEVINALVTRLHQEDDSHIGLKLAQSLFQFGIKSPEVVDKLMSMIMRMSDNNRIHTNTDSVDIRNVIAPIVEKDILTLRQSTDAHARADAAENLGSFGLAGRNLYEICDLLVIALQHDVDANVRSNAAMSLGLLGQKTPNILNALVLALGQDTEAVVRFSVVWSVGQLGIASPEILRALVVAVHQEADVDVRSKVACSFGQLKIVSSEVLEALTLVLSQSSDIDVRSSVAWSLGQLTGFSTEIVALLLEGLLEAKDWIVRSNCAHLLGKIGQGDESTIQALLTGLLDVEREVRIVCVKALAKLGQRFPDIVQNVEGKLMQAIASPIFEKLDSGSADEPNIAKRSAYDYAFDALWLLVVGGEIEDEDE